MLKMKRFYIAIRISVDKLANLHLPALNWLEMRFELRGEGLTNALFPPGEFGRSGREKENLSRELELHERILELCNEKL